MFLKSKRLKCQLYENEIPIDLSFCEYSELLSLISAIQEIWKEPEFSDSWYVVELKEKKQFFSTPILSIRVSAFTLSPNAWRGKRKLNIHKVSHGRPLGERVRIHPRNTLTHTWKEPVEVVFC